MACGCNRKVGRGITPRQGSIRAGTRTLQAAPQAPRKPEELRALAAKTTVDKQLNQSKTIGGLDKDRREVDRRRRLMILKNLGQL